MAPSMPVKMPPAKPQPARVAGTLINGTSRKPAANVEIELVRPGGLNGQTSATLKKTRSAANGHFDFGPLMLDPNTILTVRVHTPGFDYESPAYDARGQLAQFLPPGAKPINSRALEMTIFDSSTAVPLVFTVHHVAISAEDRRLNIVERIVAENHTRTTFVGGPDGATIKLNLPADAHDVELDLAAAPGGKLIKKDDGWWVAKAITPELYGARNAVIVKYHMEYQGGSVDLSRKIGYPVKFFFMVREQKDKDLIIDAPLLSKDQVQQIPIDGKVSDRIVNTKGMPMGPVTFQPGTLITMRVSRPADPMKWGFVAFVVLLCVTVPGALLLMRRGPGQKIAEPAELGSVIGAQIEGPLQIDGATQSIIDKIAVLDEQWAAGDIARNEYMRQRTALKAQALGNAGDSGPELP